MFPARSIERFADDAGTVSVWLRRTNKEFRAKPDNSLFWAKRVWDQRAESGYMKETEDKFQILADRVVNSETILTPEGYLVVSRFFILRQVRVELRGDPIDDAPIRGVAPERPTLMRDASRSLELSPSVALACSIRRTPSVSAPQMARLPGRARSVSDL